VIPHTHDRFGTPSEKEDEATTLLPAQLIRDGTTVATTPPLRVALARLGKEPGVPGSQIEEKTHSTHKSITVLIIIVF